MNQFINKTVNYLDHVYDDFMQKYTSLVKCCLIDEQMNKDIPQLVHVRV